MRDVIIAEGVMHKILMQKSNCIHTSNLSWSENFSLYPEALKIFTVSLRSIRYFQVSSMYTIRQEHIFILRTSLSRCHSYRMQITTTIKDWLPTKGMYRKIKDLKQKLYYITNPSCPFGNTSNILSNIPSMKVVSMC